MVEALLVDGENHHLGRAEYGGIVERTHFDQHGSRQAWCPAQKVRAALGAELASGRILEVTAGEARFGHAHDDIGVPARDVLAFSTVALALE